MLSADEFQALAEHKKAEQRVLQARQHHNPYLSLGELRYGRCGLYT